MVFFFGLLANLAVSDQYPQWWRGEYVQGEYEAWFSTERGAIVLVEATSPDEPFIPPAVSEEDVPNPPPLLRLSDWMFVLWQDFCKMNAACIKKLNWVIHAGVTNPSSKKVAEESFGYKPGSKQPAIFPAWPGYQYYLPDEDDPEDPDDPDDPADNQTPENRNNFNAQTGSPNGYGVAFLLQQRREDLRGKVIHQINIFGTDDNRNLCLSWKSGPNPKSKPAK